MSGWLPVRYARQNLLIGRGGEAAGLYRLPTVAYAFLPAAAKWRWLRTLERLATVIGADFSLYRVTRAYPAQRYVDQAMGLVDPRVPDSDRFRTIVQAHRRRLQQLASHAPEVYLAVALVEDDAGEGMGRGLVRSIDTARRRLEDLAGVGDAQPIPGGRLRALAGLEQRIFDQLRQVLAARRATSRELEWLLRRAPLRGIAEPTVEPFWAPDALVIQSDGNTVYEPVGHDLWQPLNAPITEPATGPGRLVVENEAGDSHQAFLAVGVLADAAPFPGPTAELLHAPLEGVRFPVDAVLHARWVGNRQALAQVRKRITDVEHVYREQTEGSVRGPGFLQEEDRVLAREYEAVLQGTAHPPMLQATISLALGAPDAEELERRVDALRERYGVVQLHRPRGLQEALFLDHLPRPDGGRVSDYRAQMTVEQFGALMPIGTQQLGGDEGIYLGTTGGTGGGRPVRYDPTAPSRQARTSAVLLAGTLGSGKTVAAELIAYLAERRGSLVVDFDPKPDHAFDQIPDLEGRVQVLELAGDEDQRGALDPLQIGLDDLREELASSYYLDLLRDPPPSWENQIQRAVRDVVRAGGRSSLQVIDRLRDAAADGSGAAGEVADALEVVADFGLARLGFGSDPDGPAGEAVRPVAPVTTIRTPGLTLPDPRTSRESYTRSERVSVATLALVAAYALRLVSRDRSRHKIVLLDEAWFLLSSTQGRSLINRLVRLGRAFNATVLLATQRLEDLGDLSDLVGTYLIFGQESDAEAGRALQLIGLDPQDQALVARVREYRKGRCLMRDLDGRVGELQIDPASDTLLQALDTTPKAARA
ncbi:ATP-binding protein [Patulibacter sp. NPDC049589]|uniref:ATP-binding protein n=1 Tax=Patulibacter sp. NPDC049589 TaxID=3154731 RepID=UPI00341BCDD1